ncbi:fumarate reductase [Shewanella sp. NFH-SH190041]|uniref:fumarate reductase cytochrome b subunit n=1 Tax=Shewanella sp. NFH-SH190041 TaxID=2950245 RepID=UPI0021C42020|nr:fumarate reductase cytochrome b subunit [Shewanella sp. NFH-SH190041]BDM63198.1 fumarate reductase [Shewanella sp. NFH-SH190041]
MKVFIPNPFNPRVVGTPGSARADMLQSATGIILGLFLLVHLHFESSILLGKEAFFHTVQFLEGSMFSDTPYGWHWVTRAISVFMLVVFIIHAVTALRRFPAQLGQWRALRNFQGTVKHGDTTIWFWQLLTGCALFFLVPVHLFQMIQEPSIGPNMSPARVYLDNVWVLYSIFLPIVIIHGVFGLYRVSVKWGLFKRRNLVRSIAMVLIAYLFVLGLASLCTYLHLGAQLTLPVTPYVPH